jgi:hypothetical protein
LRKFKLDGSISSPSVNVKRNFESRLISQNVVSANVYRFEGRSSLFLNTDSRILRCVAEIPEEDGRILRCVAEIPEEDGRILRCVAEIPEEDGRISRQAESVTEDFGSGEICGFFSQPVSARRAGEIPEGDGRISRQVGGIRDQGFRLGRNLWVFLPTCSRKAGRGNPGGG